ncbi:MAG: zinc ribbon domain-containing protein [Blastocatellia bacterium]
MYCPKCAAQAVPGQRFCRSCGTNLGVILDAIDGKQPGPIDFEALKNNLRELGSNLRAGFEQASAGFKNTKRLDQNPVAGQPANFPPPQVVMADMARDLKSSLKKEISKGLNKVRVANSRKHSLQQATLSIFSGVALMVVWNILLGEANGSGLLTSLEALILQKTQWEIVGLVPIIRQLWLLGAIPMAKGVAHLLNGIFFAPKMELSEPDEPVFQQSSYPYSTTFNAPVSSVSGVPPANHIVATTTNELNQKAQASVTEDATLRFGVKETQ